MSLINFMLVDSALAFSRPESARRNWNANWYFIQCLIPTWDYFSFMLAFLADETHWQCTWTLLLSRNRWAMYDSASSVISLIAIISISIHNWTPFCAINPGSFRQWRPCLDYQCPALFQTSDTKCSLIILSSMDRFHFISLLHWETR